MGWNPARAWTSQDPVGGYRHFQLVLQGGRGDQRWVELEAVLEPGYRERVRWRDLKDRSRWISGWQSIPESHADPAAE